MKKPAQSTPEAILEAHDVFIQTLVQRLRHLIKNTVPQAVEKAYPGWHGIGYRHPTAGYFCCIFPLDDQVKLAFEYGALLADEEHLLKRPPTSSKQVRYLEIRTEQDVRAEPIASLLLAAVTASRR
jgi:hypothetical protein